MKRISIGLAIFLLIAGGVYLLFNHAEQSTETNAPVKQNNNENEHTNNSSDREDEVVDQFDPGKNLSDDGKVSFTIKDNHEKNANARTMDYVIKNEENHEITLNFGSSMMYDFYITDRQGQEVYRHSDGKSYMQVLKEMTLAQDEREIFKLKMPALDPGNYTLTVTLAANGYDQNETSIDFTVDTDTT